MFLFDKLFGVFAKKEKHEDEVVPAPVPAVPHPREEEPVAPGTQIHYSPELIERFKADHQRLLGLFGAIKSSAGKGDVASAAAHLEEFRGALQGHLLTENVRLYVYLEHALAGDAQSHMLMHEFRHEMDEIGKAVVAFLSRYRDLASRPDLADEFGHELEGIGKVLVQRIQREEQTLYPLYLPA